MAWVDIPNGDLDPESPITTSLMTALRDNVAAAFAKDAGAPVLANDYVTNAMIASNAVNADSINANAVSTSEINNNSVTWDKLRDNSNTARTATVAHGTAAAFSDGYGVYAIYPTVGTAQPQVNADGTWQNAGIGSVFVYTAYTRLYCTNFGSNSTVKYRKVMG